MLSYESVSFQSMDEGMGMVGRPELGVVVWLQVGSGVSSSDTDFLHIYWIDNH